MISLLVWILILLLIFAIVWLIVQQIPLPPPWKQIILAIIGIIFLLIVLFNLLPLAGHPLLR